MIVPAEKQDIYQSAMATMREWYGTDMAQQGACLYLNQCAMRELAMRGHRPVLQAGDMLWRIVPRSQDDGTRATHFGYEFNPDDPFSRDAIAKGLLPEIHVWCALPEENAIVDFSTDFLPTVAKKLHGFDWLTELPPQYIFGWPPPDAYYRPTVAAIRYAWRFILEKLVNPQEQSATGSLKTINNHF